MKDNISDMLTRIRNGQQAKKSYIFLYNPAPKVCLNILNILYKEGFIRGYKKYYNPIKKQLQWKVLLKYDYNGKSTIKQIVRISKPSRRVMIGIKSLWKLKSGMGIFIISTTKGLMTDKEARFLNLGGEVLLSVF